MNVRFHAVCEQVYRCRPESDLNRDLWSESQSVNVVAADWVNWRGNEKLTVSPCAETLSAVLQPAAA